MIGEVVEGFDMMDVSYNGGREWIVTSWRNGTLTGHVVDLPGRSCTCGDDTYNQEGEGVCDHVLKVNHVAPSDISIEREATQFLLEAMQTVQTAQQTGPTTYPASEAMDTDGSDSGQSEADTGGSSGPSQEAVEGAVGAVEAWLVDVDIDHEEVEVWPGAHGDEDGVRVDWMKADLGEKDHEYLKKKINDVDGTTYHAGWMDEGCQTCGSADGEGFYHFPVSVARGL